jgi:hypothetical protein
MATQDDASSISGLGKEAPEVLNNQSQPQHPLFEPVTRASTRRPQYLEGEDLVNLPSRTLGNDADLEEYIEETTSGQILKEVKSNKTGEIQRYELVTWKINDPENPKNWSKAYKWWCTMTVALTCFVVAFNSGVITADVKGPAEEFHVSEEVALLSVTLFVMGFGIGKSQFQYLWSNLP